MNQFFVSKEQVNIEEKKVIINGDDYNHIRNVLRIRPGEELSVIMTDSPDRELRCAVLEYTDDKVICELRFIKEETNELGIRVHLFQGIPKGDKMETIIQKNVELGVCEIIPVSMKRCIVKLDEKKASKRTQRWTEISKAAAMQSKRGIIPVVDEPMDFKHALGYAKEKCKILLLPYEMSENMGRTKKLLKEITPGCDVAVFIGPEGGFDDEEIKMAKDAGFETITLGKRILRTETAGMYMMSVLSYLFEE